jgi:hypothetical protein
MKQIFILAFIFSQLFSESTQPITIKNQHFSLVKERYDVYDSKGEFIRFYKENNETVLFRLTLKDVTGNCSSKSLQDGAYKIDDNGITLYSFWDRVGRAYLEPYGARVERYELQDDGKFQKVFSKIYMETTRQKQDDDSGMKYLFTKPKTVEEEKALQSYVAEVENIYKGTFVFGEEAKALIATVKKALRTKVKLLWQKR